MFEPSTDAEILAASRNSLAVLGGGYQRRSNGDLEYAGERPGPGWHVHGWFARQLTILIEGEVCSLTLWKRRWLDVARGATCHSRPADELGRTRFCGVIVVLKLWAWLSSNVGLCHYDEVSVGLERHGSRRSVQRWLARALPHALRIQQHIRGAIIERSEPRPVEQMFPRGLSPPDGLLRRRWQDPNAVVMLWRGLALLLGGASRFDVPTTVLLAEARGRRTADEKPVL